MVWCSAQVPEFSIMDVMVFDLRASVEVENVYVQIALCAAETKDRRASRH